MVARANITVTIGGAKQLRKELKNAGIDMADLRRPYLEAAQVVSRVAKPRAPRLSGALAGSHRPGATRTMGKVTAGSSSVPYANPIHWGWRRRNIQPNPWLSSAAQSSEPQWIEDFIAEMNRWLDEIAGDYT